MLPTTLPRPEHARFTLPRLRIALAGLASLVAVACGKPTPTPSPAASPAALAACRAVPVLLREHLDADELREVMSTGLSACSDACDHEDAASCDTLADGLGALCDVSSAVCTKLCDPAHPDSLSNTACKIARTARSAGTTKSGAAPTAAPARIAAFVPADGRFSVNPPVAGNPTVRDVPDPNGGTWQSFSWTPAHAYFAVQRRAYPSPAVAVAETRGFIPTRDAQSIQLDKERTVAGHQVRDLVWSDGGNLLRARFVIDGAVVFKIVAGGRIAGPAANAFVDSFALLGVAPGAAPIATTRPSSRIARARPAPAPLDLGRGI